VWLLRRWPWKSCPPLRPATGGGPGAVPRAEALRARPGFDQRAVHREVFVGEQRLDLRLRQHRGEQLHRHVTGQQPVAVLGEGRRVPHRIVHPKPHEPAEQQVELDPLDQLALGADRIERLQQQGAQQPLGRDRFPAGRRVERIERRRQVGQRRVDDAPDRPQRVVRPHPLLQVHVAEQRSSHRVTAAHLRSVPCWTQRITVGGNAATNFSSLLVLLCHRLVVCRACLQAARTSRQGSDETDGETAANRADGVWHVALRPDGRRRAAGSLRVAQVPRAAGG